MSHDSPGKMDRDLNDQNKFHRTCYWKDWEPPKRKPKQKHPLKVHVWAGISRHGAAKHVFTTYHYLKDNAITNKAVFIEWLCKEQLIDTYKWCLTRHQPMNWVQCKDRSDGLKWECRRTINRKSHRTEASICKDTWFENSNMTLKEIVKYTYWRTTGIEQYQIMERLPLATNTGVDWDSFCREVCGITIMHDNCKIGGPGKNVQIDGCKLGKRKYHRGHHVKGQWVFGGIEQGS